MKWGIDLNITRARSGIKSVLLDHFCFDYLQADCSELWHMHVLCDASCIQELYCIYNFFA